MPAAGREVLERIDARRCNVRIGEQVVLGIEPVDDMKRARVNSSGARRTEVFARQPPDGILERMSRDHDVMLRRSEKDCRNCNEKSDKCQPFHQIV